MAVGQARRKNPNAGGSKTARARGGKARTCACRLCSLLVACRAVLRLVQHALCALQGRLLLLRSLGGGTAARRAAALRGGVGGNRGISAHCLSPAVPCLAAALQ